MLGVISAVWLARRLASAQDQAYCPCELGMSSCGDCCQPSQAPSSQTQGSPARKSADPSRLVLLRSSSPLFAAKLD